nr:hypothetical protein [Tanacetum cinerariifolium]
MSLHSTSVKNLSILLTSTIGLYRGIKARNDRITIVPKMMKSWILRRLFLSSRLLLAGLIERAINPAVAAVHAALAGQRYQLHALALARLEAHRRAGWDVEPVAKRRRPVEVQPRVGFEEGVVRAHLHRPVAPVEHLQLNYWAVFVQNNVAFGQQVLARHGGGHRRSGRGRAAEAAAVEGQFGRAVLAANGLVHGRGRSASGPLRRPGAVPACRGLWGQGAWIGITLNGHAERSEASRVLTSACGKDYCATRDASLRSA